MRASYATLIAFGEAQRPQVITSRIANSHPCQDQARPLPRPCSDDLTVMGIYPLQPADKVGGHEGVGEVVAVGSAVADLAVGDRVVPTVPSTGTWRTHVVTPAAQWFKVSKDLPLHDAATLLVNPGTALLMLEDFVELKPGDVVMQNGANSEVGKCAPPPLRHHPTHQPPCVQLPGGVQPLCAAARYKAASMLCTMSVNMCVRQPLTSSGGRRFVISIAKSKGVKTINIIRDRPNWQETVDELTALGATVVATADTVKEKAEAAGLTANLALNCVGGGEPIAPMIDLLANDSFFVSYGVLNQDPISISPVPFIFKNITMKGFWISVHSSAARSSDGMLSTLGRVQQLILDGVIKSSCQEVPFADWKTAFGTRKKKMLLTF